MAEAPATHREAAHGLLAQADAELAAGDLPEASERGWEAAAQMVKALAERRGWPHDSDRHIVIGVQDLAREAGDPEIHHLFVSAHQLHFNYFEHWLRADVVRDHLSEVRQFVARLDALPDA